MAADFQQGDVSLFRLPEQTLERSFPKANEDTFVLSHSGQLLLIFKLDGELICLRVADGRLLWTQQLPSRLFLGIAGKPQAIDKSENWAIAASGTEVNVVSMRSSAITHRLSHPRLVYQVIFLERAGEAPTVVSTCEDGFIRFWDLDSGQLIKEHRAHASAIYSVAFSDDCQLMATGGFDHTVRIWQLDDLTESVVVRCQGTPDQIGFLAGAKLLFRQEQSLHLWSTREGAELLVFPGCNEFRFFSISPDGNQVAIPRNGWIELVDGRPQK